MRDIPENATVLDHGWGWRIYRINRDEPRCFFDDSGDDLSLEEALESIEGDEDEVAACRRAILDHLDPDDLEDHDLGQGHDTEGCVLCEARIAAHMGGA